MSETQRTGGPTSDWITVADVSEIAPGTGKEIIVTGKVIALFNIDGEFHALDGVCPHSGGPLGEGTLQGCVVTCPWHGWQFDVTNGQHTLSPALSHPRYESRVENGSVQIRIA